MAQNEWLKCLTDRAGFLVADLSVFGITNTVFATMFWYGVIAKSCTSLDTTSTSKSAGIPR